MRDIAEYLSHFITNQLGFAKYLPSIFIWLFTQNAYRQETCRNYKYEGDQFFLLIGAQQEYMFRTMFLSAVLLPLCMLFPVLCEFPCF